jgi:Skp family chaperone for outer membrane proteins
MLYKVCICALSLPLSIVLFTAGFRQAVAASSSAPGAPPASVKIGVVDIQKAIIETHEGKKEFESLQAHFGTRARNSEDLQKAEQEIVNRMGGKMLNVLQNYAHKNGYTLILDVSSPQTPVLWASDGTVITKDLVNAYNAAPPATTQ